ncbi:hypothetical protein ACFCWG_20800, partial [Streptomyces sp. NPDC056390]|uniref:hypothetical protein n=1 Tax=Streptomyces sp. NPDC056390 TaxID=3345806 RepID=UPI0035D85AA4
MGELQGHSNASTTAVEPPVRGGVVQAQLEHGQHQGARRHRRRAPPGPFAQRDHGDHRQAQG